MNDNYKRIKEIGKGGMATVYLARDIAYDRLVAVKVLKTSTIPDKDYIKRFFREARLTSQLDHPNIIKIIESNFTEGIFYIVTEFVEGGDFSKFMAVRVSPSPYSLGLKKKLTILNKVLSALDYAHKNGIIHRDVKPSNILLTRELEPKLSDFGIATALWGQDSRYTRTDEIVGTMDYIAPEQKENSKNVDLRADLYSIGVIMYQLITGRKPMGAFPPPKKACPSIPEQLDNIVMKCLQPLPIDRYKNASNLSLEIGQVLSQLDPAFKPKIANGKAKSTGTYLSSTSNNGDQTRISNHASETFNFMLEKLKKGSITEKLNIKNRFIDSIDQNHETILLELINDKRTEGFLKETVILALGKIKSKKACPFLIELLDDPYYNKMAAEAIGEIGCSEPEAEKKLFDILLTQSETSYIALVPLGKLNSIKSINLISQYLTNRHTWIREMALDALALIHDKKVRAHIENSAQKDPDAVIRGKAKKILWRLKQ